MTTKTGPPERVFQALPQGRQRLPREVIASPRGRLLDAMAATVAEKGYPATTVADVVKRAGMSRKTFYEHFADKQDCFLAAYGAGVEMMLDTMRAAIRDVEDWRESVVVGIKTYLEVLGAEPFFGRAYLLEVMAAGPEALERRAQVHQEFADLWAGAETGFPPHVVRSIALGIVGAINELVSDMVRAGRRHEIPSLEPIALYIARSIIGDARGAAASLSIAAGSS